MGEGRTEGDPLSQWLTGAGLATLDAITGEALDVLGVMDRQLTLRYLNWTHPSLTREGIVGRNVLELVPQEHRELAGATYRRVLETGAGTRFETVYRDGAGLHVWDVRVGPIRHQGEVIGLIAITSNVTEQRRAHADRDRFFSLSLDMLVVASPNGYFRRLNPAFSETLGYELAELTAVPFIEFVHPEDRPRTQESFETVLRGTPITDFENRFRRKDGAYRMFSWRATVDPIIGDVYAVARDITGHRTTEAQLRHAQKMEAVGQLAGGIAHDFNNLLQAILANAEFALASGPPAPEVAECLCEIESAGTRAADLTSQLLAFSRRQALRPVPVDLNELVRSLMKMLRRLLPESIAVDFLPGHALASVHADPGQLEQVIVNLCVNARDAMDHGGHLTIETANVLVDGQYCEAHAWAKPGRYVLLSVTDTGVGMTPEVRERIFEPFFTTKGPHQGTGLGLSTVYGIVQQHDGMIQVESEPGAGATFEIYLPADSRLAAEIGNKRPVSSPRGRETILLAEDDERVRRATLRILQQAGYRALAVSNGFEAIRLLRKREQPVQLMLLDLVMPQMSGPEAWEQLRALRPGLRVLFTSGYADDKYRKRLPPDAEVLDKPFRTEELLSRIRKKLDE
ncbi:MAG TPA: PAS domain-containing protein [Polyangiaceae bacterium]|nr:PAS domain-containing protein [Polyangiaceae bacterium]